MNKPDAAANILIADRNPNVLEFLRREFLREGYRVQLAKDGFDVCNLLRSHDAPDLVILDLDLPFLDDFVTSELVDRQTGGLPIILRSVGGEEPGHPLAERARAFLDKGDPPDRLKRLVREALFPAIF